MMGLGGLLTLGGGAGWLTDQGVRRLVVATAEGLSLQAMLLEPTPVAGTTKRGLAVVAALKKQKLDPRPGVVRGTVVLLHGFNARKEHMLPFAERFCAAGFRCVLYDSRGHGDSGGRYATFGVRETGDLRRVIEAARPLAGPGGLGPLGLLGYSMGGAVAMQAQPDLPEVKALASVAAFADFRDVITNQATRRWQGFGTPLVPLVRKETRWKAGFDPWDVRPVEAVTRLTCPIFLAHGEADALVPVSHVHRLAAAAGARLQQVMLIPKGTHGDVFMTGGDALWGRLAVFFVSELTKGQGI